MTGYEERTDEPVLISRKEFQDLCFCADLAWLRTGGPDAHRMRAVVKAVLAEVGYAVEEESRG